MRAIVVKRAYGPAPVTMRAAGARVTILLDPSSRPPGSVRRAARSQAGAPVAAQRRGRTSLAPASGGGSSRLRKGWLWIGLCGVAFLFPERGGRSGSRRHPSGAACHAGGCHDHVSGTGLLSHVIERGLVACSSRKERAHPMLGGPPVTAAAAELPCRWLASGPAGARRGSAARGRSRWWRSSSRAFSR